MQVANENLPKSFYNKVFLKIFGQNKKYCFWHRNGKVLNKIFLYF